MGLKRGGPLVASGSLLILIYYVSIQSAFVSGQHVRQEGNDESQLRIQREHEVALKSLYPENSAAFAHQDNIGDALQAKVQSSVVEIENNEEEALEIDPMAVAASGYGHKGGKKKSKKHKAHYGDKGVKGYKGKKWGKKGKKYFKKHFDKKYKKKKGHHEGKKFHGDFFKGNKGHKAAKYGKKGHHNKGHKTKGFKNTYHKNEYSKKTKFYDSFDNGGYHKKFGGYKGYYGGSKGKKFKGGKHTGGFHGDDFGKKGYDQSGKFHDEHKGSKGQFGHKKKYGGKASSSKGGKGGGYGHGGHGGGGGHGGYGKGHGGGYGKGHDHGYGHSGRHETVVLPTVPYDADLPPNVQGIDNDEVASPSINTDLNSELLMDDPHQFETNDHHDLDEDTDRHPEHHSLPPAITTTSSSLEPIELRGTPTYATPGGYAPTRGYSSLGAYPSPGDYSAQIGYSVPGGYTPTNGYASPQAFPSNPTTPTQYYTPEHYKTGGHGYLMGYHDNLSAKPTHPVTPQIVYAIPSTQAPQAYHPFSGFYQTNSRQLQKRSPQDGFGHHPGEFDAVQDIGVPKKPHSMFASSFALRRIPKLEFKDVETTAAGVPVFHDAHKIRPQARGGSSFGGVYSYGANHNVGSDYSDYNDGGNDYDNPIQRKNPVYDDYGPGPNKGLGSNDYSDKDFNDYGGEGRVEGGGFGNSGQGIQGGHGIHENSEGFDDFADVFNTGGGGAGGGDGGGIGGGRGRGRGGGGGRGRGGGGGGGGGGEFHYDQGAGFGEYDSGSGPSQAGGNDYDGNFGFSQGGPNQGNLRHGGNNGQQALDNDAPPYGDFALDEPVSHDVPRGNQNRGAGGGLRGGLGGGGFHAGGGGGSDSFGFGSDPGFDFR